MSKKTRAIRPLRFKCTAFATVTIIFLTMSTLVAQNEATLQANDGGRRSSSQWVAAWQGSPTVGGTFDTATCPSDVGVNNQTIRNIIFASTGGDQVRVRLSNVGGSAPLRVGAASVALSAGNAATVAGTSRVLRFSGSTSTVIAAEGEALSDAVSLNVDPLETLAVSIYLPDSTGPATQHYFATQDNYLASGDQAQNSGGTPFTKDITCWMFLSGVHVKAARNVKGTVVTLGDSITDGYQSTTDANLRYPDQLARALCCQKW